MENNFSEINDVNFQKEVIKSKMPVVVDFYTSWCGPCKALMPQIKELAKGYAGKIKFVKMNVEKNSQTPSKFGIMSVPNILFFEGGKIVEQIANGTTVEKIKKIIDQKLT